MNDFASALKRRRNQVGLTQKAVAAAVGVDSETYYRYERGTIPPRLDTAQRIAAALGVSLRDLLPEDAQP